MRAELSRGILQAKATSPNAPTADAGDGPKRGRGQKRYEEFFGLEEPVRKVPAQRMLALRRAERENVLTLRLVLPQGRELELFRERFSPDVAPDTPLGQFLDLLYGHAYDQHVHRACEQTVRHHLKERADRETVRSFGRAVRAQMMAPVLDDVPVAALRASAKSAWFVALAADGQIAAKETLPVPAGEEGRAALRSALADSIRKAAPNSIAIPHGRREEQAAKLLRQVLDELEPEARPRVVAIDETASVVWATSPNARRRHAGTDTGLRATLSLARRLRDPLTELMRVEPRGLGLGQNLTEVHQGMLNRQLDSVLTSCLARIGVDVNRADPALLARLPGVSRDLAKAITSHRSTQGAFDALEDLTKVESLDELDLLSIAGFLRVRSGREPLDATAVHPEEYAAIGELAKERGTEVTGLIGKRPLGMPPHELARITGIGPRRARRVVAALESGEGDPRGRLDSFQNEGVARFEDLKPDLELRGRISNLTEFGAFVDLGVGQDGLVHVSQIPGYRLRDPDRLLRVGEIVQVYVVHLDEQGRRISLSMQKPRHLAEGRPATLGERMAPGSGGGRRDRRGGGRRGRDEQDTPVMNRAARVPDARRGGRRGPKPKARPSEGADILSGGGGRRGSRPQGQPRVITVESERKTELARGHKGELRSLAGLKALLPTPEPEAPKAQPAPPPPAPEPAPEPTPEDRSGE